MEPEMAFYMGFVGIVAVFGCLYLQSRSKAIPGYALIVAIAVAAEHGVKAYQALTVRGVDAPAGFIVGSAVVSLIIGVLVGQIIVRRFARE